MISVNQAVAQGIDRLRKPIWAQPEDHLKIDILDGNALGPWGHVYCPFNLECNGRDPVNLFMYNFNNDAEVWEPYTGPLPDSDAYKAAVAKFTGVLSNTTP